MQFLDDAAAAKWCRDFDIALDGNDRPLGPRRAGTHFQFAFPTPGYRLAWLSRWMVAALPPPTDRLFWVTEWSIWPSSENWVLHDRLRAGFGESRRLDEAPAILASADEIDDLAAFVHLATLFGWDAHLLAADAQVTMFLSHDEWFDVGSPDAGLLGTVREELEAASVPIKPRGAV